MYPEGCVESYSRDRFEKDVISRLDRLEALVKKGAGANTWVVPRDLWVSAKDRLPDVAGYYCASLDPSEYGGKREFCVLHFDTHGSRFSVVQYGYDLTDRITHWAPLPDVSRLG